MKAVYGTCSCAISFDHLDFRLFMFVLYSLHQDELTVSFISRWKFISYFLRKLFKFGAYANSLDHLDCGHRVLSVFYNKYISESKILCPSLEAVLRTCACAFSLDHFDLRLFMFCSHSQNQDEITVSFITRPKFIFLFLEEAVRMLMGILFIICIAVWQYFIIIFFFRKKISLPSMRVVFGIRY